MSELSQDPCIQQLELLDKITRLETTVEALSKKLEKLTETEKGSYEIISERLKVIKHGQQTHHIAFCNVFERLRNMEAKLFPNLAADMTAVKNIIGPDDDKVRNPLDHRKPKTE
jgi:hypothetical protein